MHVSQINAPRANAAHFYAVVLLALRICNGAGGPANFKVAYLEFQAAKSCSTAQPIRRLKVRVLAI
jgi:hypothetical protein